MATPERRVLSFQLLLTSSTDSHLTVNRREANAGKLSQSDSPLLPDQRLGIEGLHIVYRKVFTLHMIHQSILFPNLYKYLIAAWRDKMRISSLSPVSRQGSPCHWLMFFPFVCLLAWSHRQRSGATDQQWLNLVPLCLIIVAPATGLYLCLVGWQ